MLVKIRTITEDLEGNSFDDIRLFMDQVESEHPEADELRLEVKEDWLGEIKTVITVFREETDEERQERESQNKRLIQIEIDKAKKLLKEHGEL
jgi:hypothetical protein